MLDGVLINAMKDFDLLVIPGGGPGMGGAYGWAAQILPNRIC